MNRRIYCEILLIISMIACTSTNDINNNNPPKLNKKSNSCETNDFCYLKSFINNNSEVFGTNVIVFKDLDNLFETLELISESNSEQLMLIYEDLNVYNKNIESLITWMSVEEMLNIPELESFSELGELSEDNLLLLEEAYVTFDEIMENEFEDLYKIYNVSEYVPLNEYTNIENNSSYSHINNGNALVEFTVKEPLTGCTWELFLNSKNLFVVGGLVYRMEDDYLLCVSANEYYRFAQYQLNEEEEINNIINELKSEYDENVIYISNFNSNEDENGILEIGYDTLYIGFDTANSIVACYSKINSPNNSNYTNAHLNGGFWERFDKTQHGSYRMLTRAYAWYHGHWSFFHINYRIDRNQYLIVKNYKYRNGSYRPTRFETNSEVFYDIKDGYSTYHVETNYHNTFSSKQYKYKYDQLVNKNNVGVPSDPIHLHLNINNGRVNILVNQ